MQNPEVNRVYAGELFCSDLYPCLVNINKGAKSGGVTFVP